ncbi:MAG: signal recognition particle protein [Clostridia bacterium]|nr:signal recognition particle protein [Clostridia bacterium]
MAFEGLSEKLQGALKKMTGRGKLNEQTVKEGMREVRMALLEADVNYAVAKDFIKKVTERCVGQDVLSSLTPSQQVIRIVNEEMTALMGSTNAKLIWSSSVPTVFMLCGLQGAGKTTMCAKLAGWLTKQGKKPMLAACDIYRPAAIKQLQVVGQQVNVPVFEKGMQDPVKTAKEAIEYARYYQRDVLIIDTAGRLHIDEALMDELGRIKEAVKPSEILLTVDAMTGQDAVNVAKAFDEKLDVTGVILTKLDGDTRGGAALSIRAVTGKPIKFSGIGEKLSDIEPFHPDRMASRILGMGDVLTLIDKASEAFDEQDAEKFARKGLNSKLTLEDFLEQMQSMKKMGGIKSLIGMLPGMSGKDIDVDENALKKPEAIIRSMTPKERRNPSILNASRRKRIAAGSGTTVQDVNQLINQFEQSQKMMKQMMNMKGKGKFRGMKFPGM